MKKWICFSKRPVSSNNRFTHKGGVIKKLLFFVMISLITFTPCLAQDLPRDVLSAVYKINISFSADGLFFDKDNTDYPIENIGCGKKGGTAYLISPDGYLLTAHHVAGIKPCLRKFLKEAITNYRIKHIDKVFLSISAIDIDGHKYVGKVIITPAKKLGFFTDNIDINYFQNEDDFNDLLLVSEDKENDLSLLKINKKNVPFLNFADSAVLRVGDKVFAIGCLGSGTYKISPGKVLNKNVLVKNEVNELMGIQTSSVVQPGFSGGPLINDQYNVVGMVFAGKGASYAVPTSVTNIIFFRELAKTALTY
ncbi:MAG: serine protease [Desulfobacterales bacterium]|nr:serine protease [Desulfobacterales bacterium]